MYPLLSRFIYKIGAHAAFELCRDRRLDCPETGLIYKFIKSSQFFNNAHPTLNFHHALRCKMMVESQDNPIGFKTKNECLNSIIELREWIGLDELQSEEITQVKGFGFNDALKCRWMYNEDERTKECLDTILLNRKSLGLIEFNQTEMEQIKEPRCLEPMTDGFLISTPEIFEHDGRCARIKSILDQFESFPERT